MKYLGKNHFGRESSDFSGQASKVYEKLSSMFQTFGEAKYHSQEHMVVHK